MTVIIGINWFSEMVMIADTRMSWVDGSHPPQDIVRKLYKIGNQQKSVVFGFCGNLKAAKTVLLYLKQRKFENLKRRFVIATFKDNLRTWLEEAILASLTSEERTSLKFMLGGIEPFRPPYSLDSNGKVLIGHLINPEVHLYVYSIKKDSDKVTVSHYKQFAIIGSGKGLAPKIQQQIKQTIEFGFNQPNLHWARAELLGQITASLFKSSPFDDSVGGPFQVIRITPQGLYESYIWPPGSEHINIQIRDDSKKITIVNSSSNLSYTLYPVWELNL